MWSLFSTPDTTTDDLIKENKRLSEYLTLVQEDYELLKEAHRRVLEQMLPVVGSVTACENGVELVLREIEGKLGDTEVEETVKRVIETELMPLVRLCAEERQRLLQLQESLRLKQQEIEEQEYDLSRTLHELRTRQNEPSLEVSIQKNTELNQLLDSLKREIRLKDLKITELSSQIGITLSNGPEKDRIRRAIKRLSVEISELKTKCHFEHFSKQLTATKEFLNTELQRLTRRISGVIKERMKLQERLEAERRNWKEIEGNIRSSLGFEIEQLQKRVSRPMASDSTQTEHYLDEADSQQTQLWGADIDLEDLPLDSISS